MAHANPTVLDRQNLNAVQSDRIGTVSGARAEHAPLRVRRIVAWMDPQDVPLGAVEPRHYKDLVAFSDPVEAARHLGVEYEPRIRRPLRFFA